MHDDKIDVGKVISRWWHQNIGDREKGTVSGRARALAARLRRASMVEALIEPEVYDLAAQLRMGRGDAERLYRIVTVLAHLCHDHGQGLARRLNGEMSPARFQRLMREEGEGLTRALVRALPMAGARCNVAALGADLFYWSETTRIRWIFDYHGAAAPATIEERSQ